ncbi:motility protein A [Parapedomonas caeni]|jgi:chemotaxis protein MotA
MLGLVFLLASVALVALSVVLGGEPGAFVSGVSALLVILGTLTVTATGVRQGDWRDIADGLRDLFRDVSIDQRRVARQLLELAGRVRRDGVVCLENARHGFRQLPFLQRALGLVLDGLAPDVIEKLLLAEADAAEQRRLRLAAVLQRAADVAPAMGLIGTIIGLVQMLGRMADPAQLGPSLALALLTTLYGAILAHVLLLPMAARVQAQAASERGFHLLCASAAAALGRGEHPVHLESQLNALLPETERVQAA